MATILVVDDNDGFREMIRQMLKKEGYEVLEASDGKKGTDRYRESQPDLLIIDILMPTKEGIETICDLRREFDDIKIIAVSGGGAFGGADSYLTSAEQLGAQKILAKPFSRTELITVVKELLET